LTKEHLPTDIVEFIQNYISSLEELEILLLLSTNPQSSKTVEEVNSHLRSSSLSIKNRLEGLKKKGFLIETSPDSYQFSVNNKKLSEGVNKVSAAYRERRLKVIEAIFNKPVSGIHEFAKAFKFKGEKDE
jgi:hypothetical protein